MITIEFALDILESKLPRYLLPRREGIRMFGHLEIIGYNDSFLELLADALDKGDSAVRDFLDGDRRVIRDVRKPWGE